MRGNYSSSFDSTSALHSSKSRQISRCWCSADQCSAVRCSLKNSKRINLLHETNENKRGAEEGVGQLLFVLRVDATSIG